ncbi:MAG: hypothetical protein V8Q27_08690 [Eubacteriales bacterium]
MRLCAGEYKNPEAEHEFRGTDVPSHSYEAEAEGAYQMKGKTTTYNGKKKGRRHYTVKEWDMNIEASGKVTDITHAALLFSGRAERVDFRMGLTGKRPGFRAGLSLRFLCGHCRRTAGGL